jgi:hypothetical protein
MAERRVDRIRNLLQEHEGRARLQQLVEELRELEKNPEIDYQWAYLAIQNENERLAALGEQPAFVTSKNGEDRGWVRLREDVALAAGSEAKDLLSEIQEQNERIGDQVLAWLRGMDWRTFESQ